MDVEAYLRRIGWEGGVKPDLATLRALHRAHLLAIPYENLDVQLGRPVTIERPAIFEKIVRHGRGGWCYEMNGLFGWALEQLGFRVVRGAGAVMREVMGDQMIGNHLVLPVTLPEGLYLADVGFGDGPIEPIRLVPGPFVAHGFAYRLDQMDSVWWRLCNHPLGGAKSFDFTLAPADEALLAEKCAFLQTFQESPFVQNLVCQRYTGAGLSVLRGRVLRHLCGDRAEEQLISSADELVSVLVGLFGLDVPEAASLWPKIVARHEALFGAPDQGSDIRAAVSAH